MSKSVNTAIGDCIVASLVQKWAWLVHTGRGLEAWLVLVGGVRVSAGLYQCGLQTRDHERFSNSSLM